jgi:DMSO/TMAO reductase YedYZ heme-binding membrane subunit
VASDPSLLRGSRLLLLIVLALAAMTVAIVTSVTPGDVAAHTLVRWTARTSLVVFVLTYVARPAVQLWPRPVTKWMLAERKWLGLGFATSHAVHLAGIIAIASPDFGAFIRAQPPSNAVAATTFLLLFAMAFTSIEAVKRRMSARAWKRLHRTGMHFAWLSFTATYATAILGDGDAGQAGSPLYAIPTVILLGIAGVRVAAWQRQRRRTFARQDARAA